ncbi:MAG: cupin domain-containing protein [Acidimicrobiales bacterium]
MSVDLGAAAARELGRGVLWSLPPGSQLNANLARLEAGQEVAEHVNHEVDVLLVGLEGRGTVESSGTSVELRPQVLVHVAKGAARSIRAGEAPLLYLSIHLRRPGLQIGPRH